MKVQLLPSNYIVDEVALFALGRHIDNVLPLEKNFTRVGIKDLVDGQSNGILRGGAF